MEIAFKYLINEYYSRDLSVKSKSAKYSKMKSGEYQSKICIYGYKKGANNRLEIDEEAAKIVRMIFDMAVNKIPVSKIAKKLYSEKIPTPGEYKVRNNQGNYDVSRCQNIWQNSAIHRILTDERYIGTYVIRKRELKELGGRHSRLRDEKDWYKLPNHHPAIIDKAVFEKVNSKPKQAIPNRVPKTFTLKDKVICGFSARFLLPRTYNSDLIHFCLRLPFSSFWFKTT